jgi:hypothetical protein
MPIKHSEVSRFLPVTDMLRLGEVEDDGHSIFIVLSNWPLIGGGRIRAYGPMPIFGVFGRFKVGDGY